MSARAEKRRVRAWKRRLGEIGDGPSLRRDIREERSRLNVLLHQHGVPAPAETPEEEGQ